MPLPDLAFFDYSTFSGLINDDGTVIHSFAEFEKSCRQGITSIEKYQSLEFIRSRWFA